MYMYMYAYMCMHVHILYVYMYSPVMETRQLQATTPEDNSFFFQRKRRAALGGTRTRDVLHMHMYVMDSFSSLLVSMLVYDSLDQYLPLL